MSRKQIGPGLWDLSLAEHNEPGESYHDAAVRGLRQELGVRAPALKGPVSAPFRRSFKVRYGHLRHLRHLRRTLAPAAPLAAGMTRRCCSRLCGALREETWSQGGGQRRWRGILGSGAGAGFRADRLRCRDRARQRGGGLHRKSSSEASDATGITAFVPLSCILQGKCVKLHSSETIGMGVYKETYDVFYRSGR
jgi:hypothetical protein